MNTFKIHSNTFDKQKRLKRSQDEPLTHFDKSIEANGNNLRDLSSRCEA